MNIELSVESNLYQDQIRPKEDFYLPGGFRAVSGAVTSTELQAAIDQGAGTVQLFDATITHNATIISQAVSVPPNVAVVDMTGNGLLQTGVTNCQRVLSLEGNWCCNITVSNTRTAADRMVMMAAGSVLARSSLSGASNTGNNMISFAKKGEGKQQEILLHGVEIFNCHHALETRIECDLVIRDELCTYRDNFRRDYFAVISCPVTLRRGKNRHLPHSNSASDFQPFSPQVDSGSVQAAHFKGYEHGTYYKGNGQPHVTGNVPIGPADHASLHGGLGFKRKGIICENPGEAALVNSRRSRDCETRHCLVANMDIGLGIGARNDSAGDPSVADPELLNQNNLYEDILNIFPSQDRGNTGFQKNGVFGWDTDGLTIRRMRTVEDPENPLLSSIRGRRITNFVSEDNESYGNQPAEDVLSTV